MSNKKVILIFFILCTFVFMVNVHAANEDGKLMVYNGCKDSSTPTSYFDIIPHPENCSRVNVPIQPEQVFTIPVINQLPSGNVCQYYVKYQINVVIPEQFGPFTANPNKIINCLPTPLPRGPCKCAYNE